MARVWCHRANPTVDKLAPYRLTSLEPLALSQIPRTTTPFPLADDMSDTHPSFRQGCQILTICFLTAYISYHAPQRTPKLSICASDAQLPLSHAYHFQMQNTNSYMRGFSAQNRVPLLGLDVINHPKDLEPGVSMGFSRQSLCISSTQTLLDLA